MLTVRQELSVGDALDDASQHWPEPRMLSFKASLQAQAAIMPKGKIQG
jgi:hypothetical protein